MRNILLLIISAVTFISCGKDDGHSLAEKELIIGNWNFTKVILVNGHDNTTTSSENVEPCSGETGYNLMSDNTFSLNSYHKNGNNCELTKSRTGTYIYHESTKKIELNYSTGSQETFTLFSVTASEMWLNLGKIDTGNENDLVYHILVLTK